MITLDFESMRSDSYVHETLTSLSTMVGESNRIVVFTGAGISCSCGIPDFRSSDGIYSLVKTLHPEVPLNFKGPELFSATVFRDPTTATVFYKFVAELKSIIDLAEPSPTHRFITTLDKMGKLLRSYSQNVDGLEERAGLIGIFSECIKTPGNLSGRVNSKQVRNVQLHGDIRRVRCVLCTAGFNWTFEHLESFRQGKPPNCPECQARSDARVARAARPIKVGNLRPCIVLYDEPHPLDDEIGSIEKVDLAKKPDMLIIMGTSLKVNGFRKLVKDFSRAVHRPKSKGKIIFINKTAPAAEWGSIFDYHVVGETDKWVAQVLEDLGVGQL